MDKILPILEKYVEWIALGIGALFMALMGYSYAVKSPVSVPLGTEQLAPSAVDPAIKKSPDLGALVDAMASKNGAPKPGQITPVAAALLSEINRPVPVPDLGGRKGPEQGPVKTVAEDATIPTLPKAMYTDMSNGWGLYQWAKWQPPPAAVPGAPGVPPGAGVPAAVPFNPAGGVATQMIQQEFGWWTGKFELSMAQLTAALKAAKLDPQNPAEFKSAFLGVELYRQEKQLDGKWGPETRIAALPEYLPQLKSLPADNATRPVKAEFMSWAAQNVVMLVQPPFPQVVAGDPWYAPGTPPPAKVNQNDPGAVPVPGAPGLPGVPAPGAVPGFVPRMPPPVGPRGPAALLPARGRPYPMMFAMSGPAFGQPSDRGFAPAVPQPGFTRDDGSTPVPGFGTAPGDASGVPGAGDPEGVFNPDLLVQQAVGQALPDFKAVIYAHDITVQPGKTYQYRVKYLLRNPLFLMERVKPEYANKLALVSDYSDWSKEFTVAARVEFWVNKVNENRGVVEDAEFDVFVAAAAGWKQEKVKVAPGDQIAKGDGNSGWSLVDIRKSKDNKYEVVLTDINGQIQRRDLQTDLDDPKHRERAGIPETPAVGPSLEGVPPPGAPGVPPGTPPRRPPPGRGFTPDS
ncbi:hypothetical protein [Humisphaera borealis]|uniref:Uncharacterized protein n=1 Tax=Humisphaera borealis TaxID=2807512 RepID=A0A7M2WUR5_9BACT|nr:hypothetical protein [Humisphaera borealis]QOV89275.1 hypothetical protein IPV69_24215 [Humisphaera borealis]